MLTVFALAVALAMDAFAAAVGEGAAARPRPGAARALGVGLAFGTAQALMPLAGWALGLAFAAMARELDHWIAFVLLVVIGVRMAHAGLEPQPAGAEPRGTRRARWGLLTAAVATSIDAAAAGVTLPMLGQPVVLACAIIGAVTFAMSTAGVLIGAAAGALIGRRAEVFGGLVLIGIGTKILIEHLHFGC